jgi:PBP1b-binding outer membrane lipoprotein LpoB
LIDREVRDRPARQASSFLMKEIASRIALLIGLAVLTGGCATESAPPSSSVTTGPSPVLTAPTDSGNPPVTMSGYLDTSVSTSVK